jgi:predicted AlkP superfamily phosphohydrolase/phosphomutase
VDGEWRRNLEVVEHGKAFGGHRMKKTIVIGLDGANWELLDHWIRDGDLPHIQYLMENGSWGDSESQLPTVTCPNWKCYSTGKNPAKLGVFWWQRVDKKNKKLIGFDSRSFKSLEIFDYINKAGLKVGVVNMPTTYPPKKLDGFMITAPPDSASTGYTFPDALEENLKSKYDYSVHPKTQPSSREDLERDLDDVLQLIDSRFNVAKDLINSVDFLHVSTFYINVLQHFFYNEEPTKQGWKIIDQNIGDFIQDNYNLILMSGYLKTKTSPIRNLYKFGINTANLSKIAKQLKLYKILKKIVPEKLVKSIPSANGTIAGLTSIPEDSIDWDESKVLATGQGTVYILASEGSDEYNKLREELIKKLKNLKIPNSDRNVAKKVYKKEEIYSGQYLDIAPDIIYEQGRHIYTAPGIGMTECFSSSHKWKAENKKEGICLFYGDDIKKGLKLDGVKIVDLAPTILHLMNIPVPKDMDGRVLKEIFKEGTDPYMRKDIYQYLNEKERTKKKIKELKKRMNR